MIKKIVLLLILSPLFVKAQQNEDLVPTRSVYDSVEVSLKNDKDLYKKLLDRYIDIDTTLTDKEMAIVYYGAVFQKSYNPYGTPKKEKEFFKYYNEKNYKKALPIGEKILKEEPLNFKMVFKLLVCANVLKDEKKTEKYRFYYRQILRTILLSGDGLSSQTAFVVTNVEHEYTLMGQLELRYSSQSLVGVCDKFKLTDNGDDFEGDEIWFDVSKPLANLTKMLGE